MQAKKQPPVAFLYKKLPADVFFRRFIIFLRIFTEIYCKFFVNML